jgi:hypothetical protein
VLVVRIELLHRHRQKGIRNFKVHAYCGNDVLDIHIITTVTSPRLFESQEIKARWINYSFYDSDDHSFHSLPHSLRSSQSRRLQGPLHFSFSATIHTLRSRLMISVVIGYCSVAVAQWSHIYTHHLSLLVALSHYPGTDCLLFSDQMNLTEHQRGIQQRERRTQCNTLSNTFVFQI